MIQNLHHCTPEHSKWYLKNRQKYLHMVANQTLDQTKRKRSISDNTPLCHEDFFFRYESHYVK